MQEWPHAASRARHCCEEAGGRNGFHQRFRRGQGGGTLQAFLRRCQQHGAGFDVTASAEFNVALLFRSRVAAGSARHTPATVVLLRINFCLPVFHSSATACVYCRWLTGIRAARTQLVFTGSVSCLPRSRARRVTFCTIPCMFRNALGPILSANFSSSE